MPFTSNHRDAASLAIVSNVGTEALAVQQGERHHQQNPDQ